jgi:hypothetical protein
VLPFAPVRLVPALVFFAGLTACHGSAAPDDAHAPLPIAPITSMDADFTVTAMGDGTTMVGAAFFVGDVMTGHAVGLGEGDSLVVRSSAGSTRFSDPPFYSMYWLDLATPGVAGEEFSLAFERPTGVGGPSSKCALPAPFELRASKPTFSRGGDTVILTWDPQPTPAPPMKLHVDGPCAPLLLDDTPPDTGRLVLELSTGSKGPTCDLHVALDRVRSGSLDPAFASGKIECVQSRAVALRSAP